MVRAMNVTEIHRVWSKCLVTWPIKSKNLSSFKFGSFFLVHLWTASSAPGTFGSFPGSPVLFTVKLKIAQRANIELLCHTDPVITGKETSVLGYDWETTQQSKGFFKTFTGCHELVFLSQNLNSEFYCKVLRWLRKNKKLPIVWTVAWIIMSYHKMEWKSAVRKE